MNNWMIAGLFLLTVFLIVSKCRAIDALVANPPEEENFEENEKIS